MKNAFINILASVALISYASAALADQPSLSARQVAQIRALLPAGTDIAQTAANRLSGQTDLDLSLASSNVVLADFDKNGIPDFAVIAEENPGLVIDGDPSKPCEKVDYASGCNVNFGSRKILIYMNGASQPTFENDKIVLGGSDGGVFGDPLNGLTLNKQGSLVMNFYGGSAWRWGYTYTLQFRQDNFYLVGYTEMTSYTGDLRMDSSDTNLLTGIEIKSHQVNGDAPVKTTQIKHAKTPLVALKNIVPKN